MTLRKNLQPTNSFTFFLGGLDLEMVTIEEIVCSTIGLDHLRNQGLRWGAKASDYREEILEVLDAGQTPVLIELQLDIPDIDPARYLVVDHHGDRAGKETPTSLEQVFGLLKLEKDAWTRDLALVAANDRGHIRAMLELGATQEELQDIRARDRAAQGVTEQDETAAQIAIQHREAIPNLPVTITRSQSNRVSPITDLLAPELGGPGYDNLLVVSPNEFNFFGSGRAINALAHQFPNSWKGGELPTSGFWGINATPDSMDSTESRILTTLKETFQTS